MPDQQDHSKAASITTARPGWPQTFEGMEGGGFGTAHWRRERTPDWFQSWMAATVAVGFATVMVIGIENLTEGVTPIVVYTGAVIVAAWYGGFGAGVAATVLSAIVMEWAFMEVRYSFLLGASSASADVFRLVLFLFEGFCVSAMMRALQHARDDRAYSLLSEQATRERAEENERRLRFAVEAARMVAWEWDLGSNRVYYSSLADRVLGLDSEYLRHQTILQSVHPEDLPAVEAAFQDALDGKAEYRAEFRIVQPNNRILWVQDRGQVVRDRHDKPVRVTGVLLDISQRKEVEEAVRKSEQDLQRSNETLSSVLMAYPDVMFVVDRQGGIRVQNLAGERLLRDLGLTSLPENLERIIRETLETGEDHLPTSLEGVVEYRFRNEERHYLPRIAGIQAKGPSPFGAAIVLQDVTEFRLLDEVKTNLLATVSHEIKTPLTSIQTALLVLLEPNLGGLNSRQHDMVQIARDESERLMRTLNSLLDLTRFEGGVPGMRFEWIPCEDLIQGALEGARGVDPNFSSRVSSRVAEGLPRVRVDRERILHVLVNFLTNALKYSPEGSPVRVEAKWEDDGKVRFSVIDQGPGVAQEHQHLLFEKFFRVPDSPKHGVGLGLTIAREFVRAHGGVIGLKSEPGRGSEFFFLLNPAGPERR